MREATSIVAGFNSHYFFLLPRGGLLPLKLCLTHGFVVDEHGKKMSKSLGNFVSVGDALKELGGDIVRLWTSSMEYRNEMHASPEIILKTCRIHTGASEILSDIFWATYLVLIPRMIR